MAVSPSPPATAGMALFRGFSAARTLRHFRRLLLKARRQRPNAAQFLQEIRDLFPAVSALAAKISALNPPPVPETRSIEHPGFEPVSEIHGNVQIEFESWLSATQSSDREQFPELRKRLRIFRWLRTAPETAFF